jgi:hypothetical protein
MLAVGTGVKVTVADRTVCGTEVLVCTADKVAAIKVAPALTLGAAERRLQAIPASKSIDPAMTIRLKRLRMVPPILTIPKDYEQIIPSSSSRTFSSNFAMKMIELSGTFCVKIRLEIMYSGSTQNHTFFERSSPCQLKKYSNSYF